MPLANLARRVATLEKSIGRRRTEAQEARARQLQQATHAISTADLDLLIDATLARAHGRRLSTAEKAAEHVYRVSLERKGMPQLPLPRPEDLELFISHAALRRLNHEDLQLSSGALRAIVQGQPPTEREWRALQTYRSLSEAQYQRAGFPSEADFKQWCREVTNQSAASQSLREGVPLSGSRTTAARLSNTSMKA